MIFDIWSFLRCHSYVDCSQLHMRVTSASVWRRLGLGTGSVFTATQRTTLDPSSLTCRSLACGRVGGILEVAGTPSVDHVQSTTSLAEGGQHSLECAAPKTPSEELMHDIASNSTTPEDPARVEPVIGDAIAVASPFPLPSSPAQEGYRVVSC